MSPSTEPASGTPSAPGPEIRHGTVAVRGIRMHVARCGEGPPLVLLHGWPEFWATWEPLMARLAGRFDLVAPDLRGFGETGRDPLAPPDPTVDAEAHAADLLALLDALGLARVGLVGHDVGAYVMQAFARRHPERLSGLFFFNCPTPGIGPRWAEAGHLKETWYQYFHQQPFAAALVGASRESCATYIGHFLRHWSADPETFAPLLDRFVDNFLRPGNLQGGFDWYLSAAPSRRQVIEGTALPLPPITVPTRVLWGARDPIIRVVWMDRLAETFTDLEAGRAEEAGHFVHVESPDLAAAEIARFFTGRMSAGR
ncbi:alpha/beta fold hydrolase [Methylobacterium nodulans]|uniref:Alpha/beta hydrolase fold protein n=1 Tax=Methylobacterium nodulans (strain LMG 21967 / CNCM I-2342 / ORS 2060) TaxID=460265 RepID=B8IF92_METNO|nr:alpha/beta hydrolase [Methylobacterium nodulans]ACL55803.1 alpha/beta hydrolase fold protein [Methylobacterium nodulans ORS 2060]